MSYRAVGLGPSLRQAALTSSRRTQAPSLVARRMMQTQTVSQTGAKEILNKQRLLRPSSPHMTIYQPQVTWILSIANRITGVALSALLYGFSLAYLFAPGTFDSAHVVEFVSGLPDAVKYGAKTLLAIPFTFHSFNGVRHLSWDLTKFMSVKSVYSTAYAVLGLSAVSTVALVMM